MITVTTVRDMIRGVADRWDSHYPVGYSGFEPEKKRAISRKLADLNKEKATPDEVEAIVGNSSWTDLNCDSCGADHLPVIVTVGAKPEIESATANLCYSCCGAAWISMLDATAKTERYAKPISAMQTLRDPASAARIASGKP